MFLNFVQFEFDDVIDDMTSPKPRTSFVRSKPDEWSSALPTPSRQTQGRVRKSLEPPPPPPKQPKPQQPSKKPPVVVTASTKAPPPLSRPPVVVSTAAKAPRKSANFDVHGPVKPVNLFRGKSSFLADPVSAPVPPKPSYTMKPGNPKGDTNILIFSFFTYMIIVSTFMYCSVHLSDQPAVSQLNESHESIGFIRNRIDVEKPPATTATASITQLGEPKENVVRIHETTRKAQATSNN